MYQERDVHRRGRLHGEAADPQRRQRVLLSPSSSSSSRVVRHAHVHLGALLDVLEKRVVRHHDARVAGQEQQLAWLVYYYRDRGGSARVGLRQAGSRVAAALVSGRGRWHRVVQLVENLDEALRQVEHAVERHLAVVQRRVPPPRVNARPDRRDGEGELVELHAERGQHGDEALHCEAGIGTGASRRRRRRIVERGIAPPSSLGIGVAARRWWCRRKRLGAQVGLGQRGELEGRRRAGERRVVGDGALRARRRVEKVIPLHLGRARGRT